MNILRRTLVAAGVTAVVGLGTVGVAGAQTYTPDVDVQGVQVSNADAAAVEVSSGTLPYTGNDSSLPLAEVGAGLLAAGGLTVVMVRRQQAKA